MASLRSQLTAPHSGLRSAWELLGGGGGRPQVLPQARGFLPRLPEECVLFHTSSGSHFPCCSVSVPSCSCPSGLVLSHLAAGQGAPTRASTSFRNGSHEGRREGVLQSASSLLLHRDCYLTRLPRRARRSPPPSDSGPGSAAGVRVGGGGGESRQWGLSLLSSHCPL